MPSTQVIYLQYLMGYERSSLGSDDHSIPSCRPAIHLSHLPSPSCSAVYLQRDHPKTLLFTRLHLPRFVSGLWLIWCSSWCSMLSPSTFPLGLCLCCGRRPLVPLQRFPSCRKVNVGGRVCEVGNWWRGHLKKLKRLFSDSIFITDRIINCK